MDHRLGNRTVPIWAIVRLLDEGSLRLPSFQRDAVWDEERTELLWDSLLRGMPLGNLIIARTKPSRHLQSRYIQGSRYDAGKETTLDASDEQDFLIDGQQRAIAFRQGLTLWHEGASFRLWIDIAPRPVEQRRREHSVKCAFFLCTQGLPWGSGTSDDQRRRCRDELQQWHPDQIDEAGHRHSDQSDEPGRCGRLELRPDYRLSLGYTWPAKSSLPIPFGTVAHWYTQRLTVENGIVVANWPTAAPLPEETIRHYVDALVQGEDGGVVASHLRKRWQDNREIIVEWVRTNQQMVCQALNRQLYFELAFEGTETLAPEDLGEAFSRINRLGVRLDGADLFFSALKIEWPEAHEMVWSLYKDDNAGKLLSPPQIVHTAVRLAIADSNNEQSSEPRIPDRLGLALADARILLPKIRDKLQNLLEPQAADGPSHLRVLFHQLRKMLEYKGDADFGLPLPLLARLGEKRPHILHNLLVWLHRNPTPETFEEELRRSTVRYALVDYFFLYAKDEYRRNSFATSERARGTFPDARLIELAAGGTGEEDLRIQAFRVPLPALVPSLDAFEADLRDKDQPDPTNLDDLLLWAQRAYLHTRFPDYDPTLFFNVAALPWDRDHIWPRSFMDGRSIPSPDEDTWRLRNTYKWYYLHSFGNLRLLDRRENRSVHNQLPSEKLMDRHKAEQYFAIPNDIFDSLCNLALDNDMITKAFLENFKVAVNSRRVALYRQLHETLRLGELRHEPSTMHQG